MTEIGNNDWINVGEPGGSTTSIKATGVKPVVPMDPIPPGQPDVFCQPFFSNGQRRRQKSSPHKSKPLDSKK